MPEAAAPGSSAPGGPQPFGPGPPEAASCSSSPRRAVRETVAAGALAAEPGEPRAARARPPHGAPAPARRRRSRPLTRLPAPPTPLLQPPLSDFGCPPRRRRLFLFSREPTDDLVLPGGTKRLGPGGAPPAAGGKEAARAVPSASGGAATGVRTRRRSKSVGRTTRNACEGEGEGGARPQLVRGAK
ncbi:predicted GPI-anchored protein 58 [Octodon degus]|uniref:Predicted GPI-anchored protein 58 n=1 Tax=Octodon degus TaxID=10160 RepID=A0A6P6DFF5_OCTDE|nr:predicted GPI-anchored protein 58 [Octodon degus]